MTKWLLILAVLVPVATSAEPSNPEPPPVIVTVPPGPAGRDPGPQLPRNAREAGVRIAANFRLTDVAEAARAYQQLRDVCEQHYARGTLSLFTDGVTEFSDWRPPCRTALITPPPEPQQAIDFFRQYFVPVEVGDGTAIFEIADFRCEGRAAVTWERFRASGYFVPIGAPVIISGTGDPQIDRIWVVQRESARGNRGPSRHFTIDRVIGDERRCSDPPPVDERELPGRAVVLLPREAVERFSADAPSER